MNLNRYRIKEDGGYVFHTFQEGQKFNADVWLEDIGLLEAEKLVFQTEILSKHIETLVQGHLDQTANDWGYDNIISAVSYIGSPNTTYNNEGVMFRNWRDGIWVYVNAERVKFEAGTRAMPTDAELIAELPLLATYQ
jgi:hypothetical protein